MELGAFSVSLSVEDIEASKGFYEKLGFAVFGGALAEKWLIMKNGDAVVGLFEGMFEGNMLTFNPGWDQGASALDSFSDVREIAARLKEAGVEVTAETDETGEGPASFMVVDPDGNPILFDQHV
jgi:catechol 2,3-dioxygenase-like lactoylglutathione lyase family enzyme